MGHNIERLLKFKGFVASICPEAFETDCRSGIHALFLDFRKAFDLVDHEILLRKLAELNVNNSLIWLWVKSFLDGRSQQVNLGGIKSRSEPCPAGVLQGSIISPTLFNVHINDLEDTVPVHLGYRLVRANMLTIVHSVILSRKMITAIFQIQLGIYS